MQVSIENVGSLGRKLTVRLPAQRLEDTIRTRIQEMGRSARLKGFRPGKVPLTHLRRLYGRAVMADVVQNAVNDANRQIIEEHSLKLAQEPQVTFPENKDEIEAVMEAKADLAFTVALEVLPQIEIKDFSGIELGHTTSAAEEIAGWAPTARVVKAFNSASTKVMADPVFGDHRASMFYCGDDPPAKAMVRELVTGLGFDPIDAGPLTSARYLEPLAMLYIHLAFKQGWGSNCAFEVLKR